MDLLLVNFKLLGMHDRDLSRLGEYCRLASESTGVPIPGNYPVIGTDAFRTATGVHASAIIKARQKGDDWLADRVYSSVPASLFGLRQRIEISPLSGLSNVKCWLSEHGYDAEEPALAEALFQAAKAADHVLGEDECHGLVAAARAEAGRGRVDAASH